MQTIISETEKRILQSLHLKGCMGKCGSLNKRERESILKGLIRKNLLTEKCSLTDLGIELSKPQSQQDYKEICQRIKDEETTIIINPLN